MSQGTSRIQTTHVGSLIRSPELLGLIEARQEGKPVDDSAFAETLRHSVAEVVRQQAEAGIDVVSDGEFGKTGSWSRYVVERLAGIEFRPGAVPSISSIRGKDYRDFEDFYIEYENEHGAAGLGKSFAPAGGWAITGPIRYTGQAQIGRDIANLKAALEGSGVVAGFLPVVAPASVLPNRTDEFYKTEEEALFAIADALHEEYAAVVESGLMVQIDDAFLASYYDVMVPPLTMDDYRKWASLRVDALNHALLGIPSERCRYHVCWGSWNGPHTNDVPLRDIADLILRVNVGGYSLEMANPRHEHEWRVWETVKLPEGKVIIPGVISHATNVVEHPQLVAERLVRLVQLVGPERVIASTDCGFAQGPFGRRVHPSIMWAKLRALSEGAAIASRLLERAEEPCLTAGSGSAFDGHGVGSDDHRTQVPKPRSISMPSHRLEIRPVSGAVGAEIHGVDLAEPITGDTLITIRRTLANRGVVFFRDQWLTPEQHIACARHFGNININRFLAHADGYPEIALVVKEPDQTKNIGGGWHTDHSYDQEPALGSILYAREVPPSGGDTLFASMYAAYDALSDGLKQTLTGLRARHSSRHVFGVERGDMKGRIGNPELATQDAVHPVVITHPESGRKALYVNPGFTLGFEGWTDDESRPLLDYLYRHAVKPEFTCRFQWRKGSLAFWDNRATWHYAANDYQGEHRLMHRITLDGGPLN